MKARVQESGNTSKGREEEGPAHELEAPARSSSVVPLRPSRQPDKTERIPNELLCQIFRHACHGATTVTVTIPGASGAPNPTYALPTTVALTHVNKRWRAVATSHQPIWADVSGEVSGRWIACYIKRSGEHPLKLEIWPWDVCKLEDTIAAITQAIGRTTDLRILSKSLGRAMTNCRETQLLSALRECRSDTLKFLRLSSYPERDVLKKPADYHNAYIVVPGDFLSLGAPNLKEVIVDAPFYLPPRHTLLLNPSVHTLGMLNIPTAAFMKMIYHPPTTFKLSNLICSINWQPFLSDVDVDPEPEPAHTIVPLDQTPTVANVALFSVQSLSVNMLHRLTISPFFQSSSFKRITVTTLSSAVSPILNQQHAHTLSLLFQRAADLLPFEYVSIELGQGYLNTETISIECGRLGTAADADDMSIYRTPEEDNLPFFFQFTCPMLQTVPQWAPSMWSTMWPPEMPSPRHLRLKRDMVAVPFTDNNLPGHLATIWLQTAARFRDVTTLSVEDPMYDTLFLLGRPTEPGDAHSLPFPLLETLIVTWVPKPLHQNTPLLRIEPLRYLRCIWRTLRHRHLADFPPLCRLVLTNFGSSPPQFLKDAINMAFVEQVVMT